jgi:ketosteroid isomerase-like protein
MADRRISMRYLLSLVVVLALTPNAAAQTASPSDALDALSNGLQARDAQLVASAFAEDGAVLPPGTGPVRGRAAIEAFWKKQFEGGFELLDGGSYGSSVSGDLAYDWGFATVAAAGGGGGAIKYLNLVKRDAQGTWHVAFCTWNSNEAPAATASPRP